MRDMVAALMSAPPHKSKLYHQSSSTRTSFPFGSSDDVIMTHCVRLFFLASNGAWTALLDDPITLAELGIVDSTFVLIPLT